MWIVLLPVAAKVADLVTRRLTMQPGDPFRLDMNRVGLVMHEKYACKRVEFKQSETEFIINYVSRTIKAISYSDISDANKEEEYSLYQTEWHQYLTDKLLNSETNLSFEMLELLSLLQLVNIIPNMSTLNITLNKMKQMSRG